MNIDGCTKTGKKKKENMGLEKSKGLLLTQHTRNVVEFSGDEV